ncbi:hypothetical protein Tco_0127370 [Tanacetum coccineum]
MAQMLQAPIEGYEDAIVVPPINANNFKLKQPLINLVQSNKFTGRQDPHNHLRFFNKVTSTFRHPEVPNTSIKLLLFPFSLDGEARDWLDKEPPRSYLCGMILSRNSKPILSPQKNFTLRNKSLLSTKNRMKPSRSMWNSKNFLRQYKMPREGLAIIESKSKVRYSRSRPNDSRAITNAPSSTSSPSNNSFEIQQMAALLEDKMNIRMSRLEKVTTPATVKVVEENTTRILDFFRLSLHSGNPSPDHESDCFKFLLRLSSSVDRDFLTFGEADTFHATLMIQTSPEVE